MCMCYTDGAGALQYARLYWGTIGLRKYFEAWSVQVSHVSQWHEWVMPHNESCHTRSHEWVMPYYESCLTMTRMSHAAQRVMSLFEQYVISHFAPWVVSHFKPRLVDVSHVSKGVTKESCLPMSHKSVMSRNESRTSLAAQWCMSLFQPQVMSHFDRWVMYILKHDPCRWVISHNESRISHAAQIVMNESCHTVMYVEFWTMSHVTFCSTTRKDESNESCHVRSNVTFWSTTRKDEFNESCHIGSNVFLNNESCHILTHDP